VLKIVSKNDQRKFKGIFKNIITELNQ
jgi:hypothetical protein